MEECINLVKSEFISLLSDDKERLFVVSLSLKLKKITGSVGIKQYVRLLNKEPVFTNLLLNQLLRNHQLIV